MKDVELRIGGSAQADGAAFVDAWHRIAGGGKSVDHVLSFETWDALASIMTSERLRLLRHVYAEPAPSVMALAKSLGRQYRRVHDDVTLLVKHGLLTRDRTAIRASVDRIEAVIELA